MSTRSLALAGMALLSVLFTVLGLLQAARDAPTVDEAPDLVAALVTVESRDLRLNPEHGLLHHAVPGVLPVLLTDPVLPRTEAFEEGAWFDYTDDVISRNDAAGSLDETLFWFRVAPLLAAVATGWMIFLLGRRLGGDVGGLIAGGLWLTTPYVVGLAHLGSLDISFAFVVVALTLCIVRDRERPTAGRVVVVALVLGAALATRHSALALVPVALGFVGWHRRQDQRSLLRALVVIAVVPLLAVWVSYRALDPVPVDGAPAARFDAMISTAAASGPLERLTLAVPMPVEWQAGFAYLVITSDERPAYLLGEHWEGNRPWFFPLSAAVKLPLFTSLAVVGGWGLVTVRRRTRAAVPVALTAAVVWVFLVLQPLALGLRLAIPVLGLAFVGAAGLGVLRRTRWTLAGAGALAAAQLVAAVVAHPTSLAWTPPPFTHGYRAASDSSIDFGQAIYSLRDAHDADPFVAVGTISPRGLDDLDGVPSVIGADAEDLVGRVAVGATPLTVTARDELSWLRAYCPVEVIDEAILVYVFDQPPDRRAGPDTPAAPCDGDVSRRR